MKMNMNMNMKINMKMNLKMNIKMNMNMNMKILTQEETKSHEHPITDDLVTDDVTGASVSRFIFWKTF